MPTGAFAWPAGLVFGAGEEHGNTFTASEQRPEGVDPPPRLPLAPPGAALAGRGVAVFAGRVLREAALVDVDGGAARRLMRRHPPPERRPRRRVGLRVRQRFFCG
jgi:hypothetical protein